MAKFWAMTEAEERVANGLTAEPTMTEREDDALAFSRMRRLVARFNGRCDQCGGRIEAGEEVAYRDAGHKRIEHLSCLLAKYAPVPFDR